MPRILVATLLAALATVARAGDDFTDRVAAQINESKECRPQATSALVECTYSFDGMTLVLILDPRRPELNAFTVKAAPSGDGTFLKFGGTHWCALITHIGSKPGEVATVFISQRTGAVLTEHDAACAR